jgi:hypothetical protein
MSGAVDFKFQQNDSSQPKTALISVIVAHFNYAEMIGTEQRAVANTPKFRMHHR